MTTPTTYTAAQRIIRGAMINAGKLQKGDDPSSEDYADHINGLNDMIYFEQTQGLKIWLQYLQPLTPVAGQTVYVFGLGGDINIPRPPRIISADYYDSFGNNRPLGLPLAWADYNMLSNKFQTGPINSFFVDKKPTQLNVALWLTPDTQAATGQVKFTIQAQCTTIVSLTDAMDFPPEWLLGLQWIYADNISTGQPDRIMQKCSERATFYRNALNDWDTEDTSTTFSPDVRSTYGSGAFT